MPWWLQKELDKLQQRQQQQIFHNNYHFYNKNHSHNHLLLLPQHLHLQDTTISASSSITTATTFITTTTTTTTITTTIKTTRISYCPGHLRNGNIFFLKLLQGSEYCLFSHVEFHQNFKRNAFHFFCLRNIRGRPMYRSCFWLFFSVPRKGRFYRIFLLVRLLRISKFSLRYFEGFFATNSPALAVSSQLPPCLMANVIWATAILHK